MERVDSGGEAVDDRWLRWRRVATRFPCLTGNLEAVGVVRELELDERLRDYPYKFYQLTPEARELFDRNGLFPEQAWQRQYQSIEKTPRIRDLETMPRPQLDA